MIVCVAPLEPYFLRHHIIANPVVDVGLVRLAELVAPRHAEHFAVLDEVGSGLMETERNVGVDALLPEVQHPTVVARAGAGARFSANGDLLDAVVQIRSDVDGANERRYDDAFVLDRQRLKDGQPIVGHLLVLHRAADDDVVVAVAPILRDALQEAVDTFGEEVEMEVAPDTHHLPALGPPRVCVLQEEVGGKAGKDDFSWFDLPGPVPPALDWEVEIAGLAALATGYLAAVHLILPIDIAVLAPGADLCATVPRIPVGIYLPTFGHAAKLLPGWEICKKRVGRGGGRLLQPSWPAVTGHPLEG